MKKLIVLFLLLTTLFSVSACGKEKAKTSSSEFSSESASSESSFAQSSENSSNVLDSSSVVEKKGTFYTLQEAYDNGWLNQEQLLSIAYYHQGTEGNEELMGENYTPIPKTPDMLSEELELEIKQKYYEQESCEERSISMDKVKSIYYGVYNDCVCVKLWLDLIYLGNDGYDFTREQVTISVHNKYSLLIYK